MEKKQETQAAERVSGAVVADPAPASLPAVRRPDSIGAALVGSKRERETVAAFLNMNADDPALFGVMAIAKAYNLSPFLGELFVIDQKVKFRDATGKKVEKYVKKPGAGRDGFLSVAHKSGVHRGLQSDVVCALDSFDVRWDVYPNGQPIPPEDRPFIAHRHAPLRPGGSVADARRYRGAIIGAWAKVSRSDQLPFFFFAPLSEHGKTWTSEDGKRSGWSGAWTYTSAMIVKAASSYALRIAYSITGVVPTDELRGNDPIFELPDGPSVEQWQDADRKSVV